MWGWIKIVWESILQPAVAWLWEATQNFFEGLDIPNGTDSDTATTTSDTATTAVQSELPN